MKVILENLREEDIEAAKAVGLVSSKDSEWILSRNAEGFLSLGHSGLSAIKPVFVDFCSGKSIFKRNSIKSKSQPLVKAVGWKQKGDGLLDLTAGFGDDALLFATMGFQVTALERQPMIYLLLQDALQRLKTFDDRDEIVVENRLSFQFQEARSFIDQYSGRKFASVYYDPMFSHSGKSALSSGRMQILQRLTIGEDSPDRDLVQAILQKRLADRLIIKQALKSKNQLPEPVHSFVGKAVRYDLYKP